MRPNTSWVVQQLHAERIWSGRWNGLEARRGNELRRFYGLRRDSEHLLLYMPRRWACSNGMECSESSCRRDHRHHDLYILQVQNKKNKYYVWILISRNLKKKMKKGFCSSCISSRKVEKLSMISVQLSDLPKNFEDLEKSKNPEEPHALILSDGVDGDQTDLYLLSGLFLLVVAALIVPKNSETVHIYEPLQLPGHTLIVDQKSWIHRKENLIRHRKIGAEWEAAPTSCCALIPSKN